MEDARDMKRRPEDLTLSQLRRLARHWPAGGLDTLSRDALLEYVRAAQRLEAAPLSELRALGKTRQIKGAGRLEAGQLLPRLLQVQCWSLMNLVDLRGLARGRGIEGVAALEKGDLVGRLLQTDKAKEVPLRVRPPGERSLPALAGGVRQRLSGLGWRKGFGLAVQVAGGLGTALCLGGLVLLPLLAVRAAAAVPDSLASLAEAARGLQEPVELAGGSLGEASAALDAVGEMLLGAEGSLGTIEPLLRSIGELVGEDTPEAIDAARGALTSAEAGAEAIDATLRTLSYVSFITGVSYDPEQSLQDALAEVNAGLEPLPDDLREIQADLDAAAEDLEPMRTSAAEVAGHLDDLAASLEALEEYVLGQSAALDDLAASAARAAERAPVWVWTVAAVAEPLVVAAGLEQIAIVVVGGQIRPGGQGTKGAAYRC